MTTPACAALSDALADYTAARPHAHPYVTAIPGVIVLRVERPHPPIPLIHRPALCLVAQGAKRELFGDMRVDYGAGQAAIVSIDMPATGWVTEASRETPFLGIVIEFDRELMCDALGEMALNVEPPSGGGVIVAQVGDEVLDCALRLLRLLHRPDAIELVAPLVMRELSYWLLAAPYGGRIASMMVAGQRPSGIVAAIQSLRSRFADPVRVDELASEARMSVSTFHRQFKMVTSMTPLQYQKQLRLLEARHRMISHAANAETAAYQVGYESQSQFSREYARMFGAPPRRDVLAMRARVAAVQR